MKNLMRGVTRLFSTSNAVASKKGQISQVLLPPWRLSVQWWMCSSKDRFHPSLMHWRFPVSKTDLSLKLPSISETQESGPLPWILLKDLCVDNKSLIQELPSVSPSAQKHSAESWTSSETPSMKEVLSKQRRDIQSIERPHHSTSKAQELRFWSQV